jgi:hypothetical protein
MLLYQGQSQEVKKSGGVGGAGYEYVKIETLNAFVKIKYSVVVNANQTL